MIDTSAINTARLIVELDEERGKVKALRQLNARLAKLVAAGDFSQFDGDDSDLAKEIKQKINGG